MTASPGTTTAESPTLTRTAATKVAAGAAAVLAVSLFMTVAVLNVPHNASDDQLLAWWQDPANRMAGLFSGLFAVLVAVSIPVVSNYVRHLPEAARSVQWLSFVRAMAGAVTAVWLVTGAARATIAHLVDTMAEPLPGVDVLRYATAVNYTLLGLSGMSVLALCMLAISVVVLRTGALGRWIGYLGATCSIVMVGAVVAQFGAYTTPLAILWALGLAVAIWRGPVRA